MKITKLGHSCLIVETKGKKIMTDPGSFSVDKHVKEKNVDFILITHEHGDHLDIDSLKEVVANNPDAKIITNDSIKKILEEAGLMSQVLENKIPKDFAGIIIEAHEAKHEEIFEEFGQVENVAFIIDNRLLHMGDSLYNPGRPIEILALPVGGPWNKTKDFMNYVLEFKPKICFPVHDGMFSRVAIAHGAPKALLPKYNIEFRILELGKEEEF